MKVLPPSWSWCCQWVGAWLFPCLQAWRLSYQKSFLALNWNISVECDWFMVGWRLVSGFFLPRTPSAAEDVGSCGDRHVGRADRRQFWGLVLLVDVDIYELGVASEFGLNSMFPFPPCSSHCRRSSWPPVCCLPDPPLSLSHEEKGRGQLRPWEETHLQESPYKWVLRLKLCAPWDKWTVWKHCALQWDVLNKRSFWIEFQSDFWGWGTKLSTWPTPLS